MPNISKDEADKFAQLVQRQEQIKRDLNNLRKKETLSQDDKQKISDLEQEFKANNKWFTDTAKY